MIIVKGFCFIVYLLQYKQFFPTMAGESAHIGYVLEYSFAGLPWAEIIIK